MMSDRVILIDNIDEIHTTEKITVNYYSYTIITAHIVK